MNKLALFLASLMMSLHLPAVAAPAALAITVDSPTLPATAPGVSHALAVDRAARLSNITYRLGFTIPTVKTEPVTFNDTITFTLKGNTSIGKAKRPPLAALVLDFRPATPAAIPTTALVNGRRHSVTCRDEHLVIPAALLRAGRNTVVLSGQSDDKTLNRHDDYLYTLFVPANARSVFPCFDQPDLKARFHVTLRLPDGWTSINSVEGEPLPTYLFSFTAGRFFRQEAQRDGRTITALYRETDPKKVAQLETVFDEVALSLRWMERYTGIRMPFSRYGFVVLPGYQFGGMEHPGAIQFIDREIFLGEHPTPDEELARLNLLAHETAHLWFGDMVTMRWFNDVWTKEVFANLMASKIAREQFPGINHDLNFLHSYYMRAMSTDRTDGTHPIQQDLANLNQAGLLYGNIIYEKAPIMMQKLEELMGSDAFQRGLQQYLRRFAYSNATWDDLVAILDSTAAAAQPVNGDSHHRSASSLSPGAVKAFSDVWVKQKGMPTIVTTYDSATQTLTIRQHDPFGRGLVWPQRVRFRQYFEIPNEKVGHQDFDLDLTDSVQMVHFKEPVLRIEANVDGKGYGRFVSPQQLITDLDLMDSTLTDVDRYARALNAIAGALPNVQPDSSTSDAVRQAFGFALQRLPVEQNELVASRLRSTITLTLGGAYLDPEATKFAEAMLWYPCIAMKTNVLSSTRKAMLQWLGTHASNIAIVDSVFHVWRDAREPLLDRTDYTRIAYHLALTAAALQGDASFRVGAALPLTWGEILVTQRQRLTNADELAAFDYISRACTPDTDAQDYLFESLTKKENRRVEPWASSLLALLNDPVREGAQGGNSANGDSSNRFILPALDLLEDIQQTGDIFFPANWLSALLAGHHSPEAAALVNDWLTRHPDYFPPLRRKVLEASFLLRQQ